MKESSAIISNPIAETISRRRTFTLAQLRADYRDAQTQFIVLLTQLHNENFTGSLTLHFNAGTVCSVETIDSQKIKPSNGT
jgi:hypothetical protein